MMKCDLHIHSKLSDGSLSIKDIVCYSKKIGLDYIAISDHDTLAGVKSAIYFGKQFKINIIPAVEVSTVDPNCNRPVHMLCYLPQKPEILQDFLNETLKSRYIQKIKVIEKIMKLYPITMEHIKQYSAQSQSIYESHIMQALCDLGYSNIAIGPLRDELISKKGSCYVPNIYPDIYSVLDIISETGGISVMAHPEQFDSLSLLEELAAQQKIHGVEYNHPRNSDETKKHILEIASKYNLITTGGSDFHGQYAKNPYPLGSFTCSQKTIHDMLKLANKIKFI